LLTALHAGPGIPVQSPGVPPPLRGAAVGWTEICLDPEPEEVNTLSGSGVGVGLGEGVGGSVACTTSGVETIPVGGSAAVV
jgi:hypothetical protein